MGTGTGPRSANDGLQLIVRCEGMKVVVRKSEGLGKQMNIAGIAT